VHKQHAQVAIVLVLQRIFDVNLLNMRHKKFTYSLNKITFHAQKKRVTQKNYLSPHGIYMFESINLIFKALKKFNIR
jgi:hypothetical protein